MKDMIDGILLDLHGAMVTESRQDPETDLLREIREEVGYEVPIMVTLDLHANIDHSLLKEVTAIFGYQSSPHIDMRNTGIRAAKAMSYTLKGELNPRMALKKPGIVVPSVFSATTTSPAMDIMKKAKEWEKKQGVVDVTVLFGFAWSDVKAVGMSTIAVTDNNVRLAEKVVQDLSDFSWEKRGDLTGRTKNTLYGVEEGVKHALERAKEADKPIIILDHADRSNDTTFVIKELIKKAAKKTAIPMFYDPDSAKKCCELGSGRSVELDIGGSTGWRDGGEIHIKGEILWAGEGRYTGTSPMRLNEAVNLGPTAILDVDGIWLQLISINSSLIDDDPINQFGYNIQDFEMIVSKSKTHFRAIYEKLGEEIIIIDAPGQCPADLNVFDYHNVPEKVYPITLRNNN
jgi:microcystin degradation protein MlrC